MAKLKEEKFLTPFGEKSRIDNSNITDEIATYLLESGKAVEEDFEELPGKAEKPKPVLTEQEKAAKIKANQEKGAATRAAKKTVKTTVKNAKINTVKNTPDTIVESGKDEQTNEEENK